jgi:hypothetical protein
MSSSIANVDTDEVGQTSQEDSKQDEGRKGYQGTYGHFGRLREE